MNNRISTGEKIFHCINYVFLLCVGIAALYPMLYVLFASFSNPGEFLKHTGLLIRPVGFSIEGYAKVFEKPEIYIGYGNTFFYVIAGTAISLALTISCLCAVAAGIILEPVFGIGGAGQHVFQRRAHSYLSIG